MNIAFTNANIIKWLAYGGCHVTTLEGYNPNGFPVYIQLHETPPSTTGPVTLSAGAVPNVKSLQCAANAPFYFTVDFNLSSCLLALSSTEANYTALAANTGLDMTVVIDSRYLCDGTEVVVGDLTTAVTNLAVFNPGPKKILRIDVVDLTGTTGGFAFVGTNGNFPALFAGGPYQVAANATVVKNYGEGWYPFTQSKSFVVDQSCTIYYMLDNKATNIIANGMACRVVYKP